MGLCGLLLKAAVGSVMAGAGGVLQVAWGALDASMQHMWLQPQEGQSHQEHWPGAGHLPGFVPI